MSTGGDEKISLVGWNDNEIMYSNGKTEIAPRMIATTNRVLFHVRMTNRPGTEGMRSRRGARRREVVSRSSLFEPRMLTKRPYVSSGESAPRTGPARRPRLTTR